MVIVNRKKASSTLYFIFFFIIFIAFCAFAVDGTIVFTNRAKLQNITEATALAAAEEFNSDSDSTTARNNVESAAQNLFDILKQDGLKTAKVDSVVTEPTEPKVTLTTSMVAQPLFLSFLGVSGINLSAQVKAVSEQKPVFGTNDIHLHWATKKEMYQADVIENDTVILKPLGEFSGASFASSGVDYKLISSSDNQPLSLGAGGFITIKLPVPIIDKTGYDLQIIESGAREGYMVFAGLDKDPSNPYIDYKDTGGGLSWVNISCSGQPQNAGDLAYDSANRAATNSLGAQDKFYGSGNFDIGDSCLNGHIHMVKYIRIVDDNVENAYIPSNGNTLVNVYGESSSPTPGADIDSVEVLNYVHLTQ